MKYLLDTHVLLWCLFEPKKLNDRQKTVILDVHNDVFASAISFWEISLKYSLKKLNLKIKPEKLPDYAKTNGFPITAIDVNTLASFHKLPRIGHKDPFDRMLIWEAINNNYTIISQDRSFADYKKFGLKLFK